MIITSGILICLIAVTSQLVHSKVITINSTSDNTSQKCCTEQGCMCASLCVALQYITSNTTINITSVSVTLEEKVKLGLGIDHISPIYGSGKLTNITITGSNVTIMCNNSGSVYCESCDHVRIEGITWDKCGDPNGTNIAGVTFNGASNISLVNCTFQHSQIRAIAFLEVSRNINVSHCNFLSNRGKSNCGGLSLSSGSVFVNLIISDSYFYDNGFYCDAYAGQIINVVDNSGLTTWNITITKTIFFTNMGAAYFVINGNSSFQLNELTFNNNKAGNSSVAGIQFQLFRNSSLLVSNSLFTNNIGSALLWFIEGDQRAEILISNSSFTNTSSQLELDNNAVPTIEMLPGVYTVVLITLVD